MSRVTVLPRALVRAILVGQGSTRKEILRLSSSRIEQPDNMKLADEILLGGQKEKRIIKETIIGVEGDITYGNIDDEEEYSFTSQKTPKLTKDDKAYLDKFRPRVDPRLSKVFRGYTALDEQGWTIPYSKIGWYSMKQIYGHYDDNDERSVYYIHPRSNVMRLLRDPIVPKAHAFDYWREKRDCDFYIGYQMTNVERLHTLGPELYAAHFVTKFGGKVKFHGFKNWFDRTNWKSLPQTFAKEFVCEAIDLSNTPLFYEGMSFLMRLADLRSLNLANCTALDEWAIARLYPLRETLIHLDLSGCHGMSDRGLVTLWKMKKLRRLVLSGMDDTINNLGLIAIELSEALPDCYIHGVDFEAAPNPKVSGVPKGYDPDNIAMTNEHGDDVATIDYEKWWGLRGKSFPHKNYVYKWRGRNFHDDWEDLKEDWREETGWLARVVAMNPFGPPREYPKRRI